MNRPSIFFAALLASGAAITMIGVTTEALSQALPNPYRMVDGWAQLPDGREMGAVGGSCVTRGP